MNDGPTEVTDLDRTDANRALISDYVEQVLIGRDLDRLDRFVVDGDRYVEHNPQRADGVDTLRSALAERLPSGRPVIDHRTCHRILAEGCFVLSACEGAYQGSHSALYDMYRLEGDQIVEHWDSIEPIPPRAEWKNDNGKF